MQIRHYTITLESPLILSADTSTTGHHRCLDYVPGRALLGLAASRYMAFGEDAWRVFHAGDVRFGDALPFVEGSRLFPTPRCLHRIKGGAPHELINTAAPGERPDAQLERLGGGHILARGETLRQLHARRTRAVKTAIDASTLSRARESALFSYEALAAGQRFLATIEADDDIPERLLDTVEDAIVGRRRMGRSRSAEFGEVSIERCRDDLHEGTHSREGAGATVILLSDLALVQRDAAHARLVPRAEDFGLPEEWELDLSRSAITHRRVDQFNGHRRSFSLARQVICRGGVLRFSGPSRPFTAGEKRVGLDVQEGMGHVLVQPSWGSTPALTLERGEGSNSRAHGAVKCPDETLLAWLERRLPRLPEEARVHVSMEAEELIAFCRRKGNKAPSPAQWSHIRQWATRQTTGSDFATLKSALLEVVGGTTKTWCKGWELDYPRRGGDALGVHILRFATNHGMLALSELAHRVRAGITHARSRDRSEEVAR